MIALILALSFAVVCALALKRRNRIRLHAYKQMNSALDTLYNRWDVLLDARQDFETDVPDEIIAIGEAMLKSAKRPFIEFKFAIAFANFANNMRPLMPSQRPSANMREPLQDVYHEMVHAWFTYISNKNLFTRIIIRNAMGRLIEKEDNFDPFTGQMVRSVIKHNEATCALPQAA